MHFFCETPKSIARRGVTSVLETRAAVLFAQKRNGEALNALEEMAALFARLADKRSQGNALLTAASMLLVQLSEEVESDTQAEYEKKEPKVRDWHMLANSPPRTSGPLSKYTLPEGGEGGETLEDCYLSVAAATGHASRNLLANARPHLAWSRFGVISTCRQVNLGQLETKRSHVNLRKLASG